MTQGRVDYDSPEALFRKAAMVAIGNGGDPGWFLSLPVCYRDDYLDTAIAVSHEIYGKKDDG